MFPILASIAEIIVSRPQKSMILCQTPGKVPSGYLIPTVTFQVLDGLSKHLENCLPDAYEHFSNPLHPVPSDRRSPRGEPHLRYDLLRRVDFVIIPKL